MAAFADLRFEATSLNRGKAVTQTKNGAQWNPRGVASLAAEAGLSRPVQHKVGVPRNADPNNNVHPLVDQLHEPIGENKVDRDLRRGPDKSAADRTDMGRLNACGALTRKTPSGSARPRLNSASASSRMRWSRSNRRWSSSARDRLACRAYSILLAPICFAVFRQLAIAPPRFRQAASQFEREGFGRPLLSVYRRYGPASLARRQPAPAQ